MDYFFRLDALVLFSGLTISTFVRWKVGQFTQRRAISSLVKSIPILMKYWVTRAASGRGTTKLFPLKSVTLKGRNGRAFTNCLNFLALNVLVGIVFSLKCQGWARSRFSGGAFHDGEKLLHRRGEHAVLLVDGGKRTEELAVV